VEASKLTEIPGARANWHASAAHFKFNINQKPHINFSGSVPSGTETQQSNRGNESTIGFRMENSCFLQDKVDFQPINVAIPRDTDVL